MGESFTAKDFRTWGGTLAAFREFAADGTPDDPEAPDVAGRRNAVVKAVAATLCNTPAVCRTAYIDPVVFEGWLDGRVARAAANARGARQWEQALLGFLKAGHRRSPARRG
jgi:DNA topoisomerase IB